MTEQPISTDRSSLVITVLLTLLVGGSAAMAILSPSEQGVADLKRPAITAVRVHDQMLTLAAGNGGGAWARLRGWVMDLPRRPLETAAAAYADVLQRVGPPTAPALHARRAVALAALGRTAEARAALAAMATTPADASAARVFEWALFGIGARPAPLEAAIPALAVAGTQAEGWAADQIRIAYHQRSGESAQADNARATLRARAERIVRRAGILAVIYLGAIGAAALLLIAALLRRRSIFPRLGEAALPPPWTISEGYAAMIRALAWAGLAGGVALVLAERLLRVEGTGLAMVAAAPAALIFLRRRFFTPRGLTASTAFGLRLRGRLFALVTVAVIVMALELALAWIADGVGARMGREGPWWELVNETVLLGRPGEVAGTLLGVVVAAPVLEEVLFRGIVYGSLRARLGPAPSALLSAALFAAVHGYSLIGTATVFLGAVVWALVYERTRSLLPSLLDHGANNALASAADLLLR
jgi:membrane protease YdiL (CAAX protease family)